GGPLHEGPANGGAGEDTGGDPRDGCGRLRRHGDAAWGAPSAGWSDCPFRRCGFPGGRDVHACFCRGLGAAPSALGGAGPCRSFSDGSDDCPHPKRTRLSARLVKEDTCEGTRWRLGVSIGSVSFSLSIPAWTPHEFELPELGADVVITA